jgi:hypothetical protein
MPFFNFEDEDYTKTLNVNDFHYPCRECGESVVYEDYICFKCYEKITPKKSEKPVDSK